MRTINAILLFFILAASKIASAQITPSSADNLAIQLESTSGASKVDLYNRLSLSNCFNNQHIGIDWAVKAIDLSEKIQDYPRLAVSYTSLAINERNAQMLDRSLSHFKESYNTAVEHGLDSLVGDLANNVARVSLELGQLDSAEKYIGIADASQHRFRSLRSESYSNINRGIMLHKKGDNSGAKTLLCKAYTMRHDTLKIAPDFLVPLWLLSDVYISERNYSRAKDLMKICLNDTSIANWHDYTSRILYRLAHIYYLTKNYDSAEYACKRIILKSYESNNIKMSSDAYKMLDSIYLAKGNKKMAAQIMKNFVEKSDTIFQQTLAFELDKIHHTSEYLKNQQIISNTKERRNIIIVVVMLFVWFAISTTPLVFSIFKKRDKIKKLNKQLEEKREASLGDLNAAALLQGKFLPVIDKMLPIFSDKFLIYWPKNIVSGDFVWQFSDNEYVILAVSDCTGHGVPGAMLTMIGMSSLQEIAMQGVRNSAEILEKLREKIINLTSMNALNRLEDGMDISLVTINKKTMVLDFAGAYNSLFYIREGKLNKIKATRCPIGDFVAIKKFESQYLQLEKGDCIFMFSDGYTSQFGGPDGNKLPQQDFFRLITENHQKPMNELSEILTEYYRNWQGRQEQVDDVTVFGFRVD